jgi:hypothetical protein
LSHLGNTHHQHLLLRYCLDACRVTHFLRGVPCSPGCLTLLAQGRECVLQVLRDTLGNVQLDPFAATQACLPLRLGGCGIKDPLLVRIPARIAGIMSYLRQAQVLGFPTSCCPGNPPLDTLAVLLEARVGLGDNFEPLTDWLPAPLLPPTSCRLTLTESKYASQKWWSDAWYHAVRSGLAAKATLRDRCRLELQSASHSTAWMDWVQQADSRGVFESTEYRLLLRWWLGLPLFPGDAGKACPSGCGQTLDVFGDHLVACHRNLLTQRHNGVRDALQGVLQRFGVACRREVPLACRLQRPGDLAIDHLGPKPILVDLTGIHPLAPGRVWSVDGCRRALVDAEEEKLNKYAVNCAAEGYSFEPLAFHCWSGLGPISGSLVNRLVKQLVGDSQGWRKTMVSAAVRHSISATLMGFVAKQLTPALTVRPRWTIPDALLEEALAAQTPAALPAGDMDIDQSQPRLPADLPPDPFQAPVAPCDLLTIQGSVTDGEPAPNPQPDPTELPGALGVGAPGARRQGARLLSAALSELAPEYTAVRGRGGTVVTVRPAFLPVAARTRGRNSAPIT